MPLIERDLSGDTCAVADAVGASSNYVRTFADSPEVSDSLFSMSVRAMSDSVVVTDLLERVTTSVRAMSDSVVVSDQATTTRYIQIADGIAVADLFVRHPLFSRVLNDVIVVDDSIRQAAAHVVLSDTVTLTEAISLRLWVQYVRSVADAVDTADLLAVEVSSLDIHVSDEIVNHDVIAPDITYGYPNRFVNDGTNVTDSLVVGKARDVVLSDTIDVADAIGRGFSTAIVLSDTVDVTDLLVRSQVAHRPRLDAVGLTDFLTATVPELADRNPFNRAPGYL